MYILYIIIVNSILYIRHKMSDVHYVHQTFMSQNIYKKIEK